MIEFAVGVAIGWGAARFERYWRNRAMYARYLKGMEQRRSVDELVASFGIVERGRKYVYRAPD